MEIDARFIGGDQDGKTISVEARSTKYLAPKQCPPSLTPNEPLRPIESEAYELQRWCKDNSDYYFLVLCGMPEEDSRSAILRILKHF